MEPSPTTTFLEINPGVQWLAGSVNKGRAGNIVLLGGSPLTLLSLRPKAEAIARALLQDNESIEGAAASTGVGLSGVQQVARKLLHAGIAEPRHRAQPHRYAAADCTIVIPAHNEASRISGLVKALHKLGPAAVVVVDDGSTDGTASAAEQAGARVVRNNSPLGPGVARNRGTRTVTTPVVVFVDADVQFAHDNSWLDHLLGAFDDPKVAVAAPRICSASAAALTSAATSHSTHTARVLSRYEQSRSPLDLGPQRATVKAKSRVAYVPSTVMAVRSDHFHELGGFDETLRYGEDVDFVWRAAQRFEVRYEGDIAVDHLPRPSLRSFVKQRFSYGTSAASLDRKHSGQVVPFRSSGWSVAVWAFAALGGLPGLVIAAATSAGNAGALAKKLPMLASPLPHAARLTVKGHFGVGQQLAAAICRAWFPVTIPVAIVSSRARRALLAAVVVPSLLNWHKQRTETGPHLDPVRFVALHATDEFAYCAGVWVGCLRLRRFHALLPDLSNWPGRNDSGQDGRHGTDL